MLVPAGVAVLSAPLMLDGCGAGPLAETSLKADSCSDSVRQRPDSERRSGAPAWFVLHGADSVIGPGLCMVSDRAREPRRVVIFRSVLCARVALIAQSDNSFHSCCRWRRPRGASWGLRIPWERKTASAAALCSCCTTVRAFGPAFASTHLA